jgi:hypothetical protein
MYATTCTVAVNGETTVTATFVPVAGGGGGGGAGRGGSIFTLATSTTGSGSVTGNQGGIACPGNCSAKLAPGTSVTLTATPQAGKSFLGWSGGCTGTTPTCTLTLADDTKVQASFSK